MRHSRRVHNLALLLAVAWSCGTAGAAEFRSTADAPTLMYDAPSAKARPLFVYGRDVPVEVIVTVEGWTKVRDASGTIGWFATKSLSDKRMLLVRVPIADIRSTPEDTARSSFVPSRMCCWSLPRMRPPPRQPLRRAGFGAASRRTVGVRARDAGVRALIARDRRDRVRVMTSVAVLGAGAWGTALCVHLARHPAGIRG